MELSSYVKSLKGAELTSSQYRELLAVIRSPKKNKKTRRRAATRVATSCYRQIATIVFRYSTAGIDLVELLNVGIAFMAEFCLKNQSYDPEQGHVMAYASRAVKGAIAAYVRNARSLYMTSDRAAKKVNPVYQARFAIRLGNQLGDEGGPAEGLIPGPALDPEAVLIANEEASREERYERLLTKVVMALDKIVRDKLVPARDLDVFRLRLGQEGDLTLKEIGEVFGISRTRVYQITTRLHLELSIESNIPIGQLEAVLDLLRHETLAAQKMAA